jgi:hypothetical protein
MLSHYSELYNAIEQDPTRLFNSKPLCQILESAHRELIEKKVNEEDIRDFIKELLKKFYPFYNLIDIMENNGDMDVIIHDAGRIAHDRTLLCFCAERGMFTKSKTGLEYVLAEYHREFSDADKNDHSGHDSPATTAYGFGAAALSAIIKKIK